MPLIDIINHLIDFNKHRNNALRDYQVIESSPIVVNGISAQKLVTTYSDSKFGNVKSMLVEMLKGDKQYEILYTSEPDKYDTLLPTIQKMVNSFQITKWIGTKYQTHVKDLRDSFMEFPYYEIE